MVKIIKIKKESGIPLIGCIAFGCIDRGTNLIQIRPTSSCNLKCPFCSTNANNPAVHPVEYKIELNYLLEYAREIVKLKGPGLIAFVDSVGETMTYPNIIDLVRELSKIKEIKKIIMITNGTLLTKEKILEFEKAGLNQLNLSINSLDEALAKKLSGYSWYDINKILKIANFVNESKIELVLAPVWIPKINDEEIEKIIQLAKKLKCKIGIQKYEIYKYSRKIKKAKKLNWWKFYRQIKEWEGKFGIKLKFKCEEFGIERRKRIESVFEKNEIVNVEIKATGWLKNQMIGVAKNSCISINNCKAKINDGVKVKILENKNNLYVAELI